MVLVEAKEYLTISSIWHFKFECDLMKCHTRISKWHILSKGFIACFRLANSATWPLLRGLGEGCWQYIVYPLSSSLSMGVCRPRWHRKSSSSKKLRTLMVASSTFRKPNFLLDLIIVLGRVAYRSSWPYGASKTRRRTVIVQSGFSYSGQINNVEIAVRSFGAVVWGSKFSFFFMLKVFFFYR